MIELTEDQRRQLESGTAISIVDPATEQQYVMLRKDVYDRVRHFLYDDNLSTDQELRRQLARSSKENGWDEPAMDAYDRYDEELRKRCP